MARSLIEIAEDAAAYRQPAAGDIRVALDDVVLNHRPTSKTFEWHEASRLRLPDDPQKRVDEIRAWFRSHGCTKWMWILGPSSTPADLEHRLRTGHDLKAVEEAGHRALLLEQEPPPGPAGVDIREVRTFEAFCDLDTVQSIAFDESAAVRAEMISSRSARWDDLKKSSDVALVAYLDGVPVAGATMAPLQDGVWFLLGGATIPEARGRGLYRALVHGRWTTAIEHGGVAMATHAGSMSAPILKSLGFVDVGRIDLLLERTEAGPPASPD
jgi:GNAT superfamily N-acetyltransferase